MSLKAFHKFFITAAIFISAWLARAERQVYLREGQKSEFYTSLSMGAVAATLVLYLTWFLIKSRTWPEE